MEFRILGPLEVVDQGSALPLGGMRLRMLLALLLTRANEVVSADRLIDALWDGRPPRTAANALQYHVSQLRKALAPQGAIVTREPGYMIRVGPDELDLLRFEVLLKEAQGAPPELAATRLRDALALWRGPPLADLPHGSLAVEILRLEELRIAALEQRLEADLGLGRFSELVGEVQVLVREHPLRERLRAALMQALYGSGRQAEALEVYRETRRLFVDELGIEPSAFLRELEQAILRQDPTLGSRDAAATPRQRAVLAVAITAKSVDDLLAIAEPLARRSARELILARLVRDDGELAAESVVLSAHRDGLIDRGVASRVATYTTSEPGVDTVRLATEHDVDIVLLDTAPGLLATGRPDDDLAFVLERAPCDVAVLVGSRHMEDGPIVTPFGGIEHDWSAIEVAAWIAQALGTTLRLLGTEADPAAQRRDASRLLSRASMLVQQVVGIVTEPVLIRPGARGVLDASRDARLLVVGLSDHWRTEGIGHTRLAVAGGTHVPTLFVRRGLRPSGVAPTETLTRFTWTIGSERNTPPDT